MATLLAKYRGDDVGYNGGTSWPDSSGNGNHITSAAGWGTQITLRGKKFVRGGGGYQLPAGVSVDLNNCSIVIVARVRGSKFWFSFNDAGNSGVYVNGSPATLNWSTNLNPTDSGIFASPDGPAVLIARMGTDRQLQLNSDADTRTGPLSSVTGKTILLGGWTLTGGWEQDADWYEVHIYSGVLDSTEIAAIKAEAKADWGVDATSTTAYAFISDSLGEDPSLPDPADGTAAPAGALGHDLASDYTASTRFGELAGWPTIINRVHSGEVISNINTASATDTDPIVALWKAHGLTVVVVPNPGTNNLAVDGDSAATILGQIDSFVAARKAAGADKVYWKEMYNRSGFGSTEIATQSTVNAALTTGYALHGLDGPAIPVQSAAGAASIFVPGVGVGVDSPDGIHKKNSGNAKEAAIIKTYFYPAFAQLLADTLSIANSALSRVTSVSRFATIEDQSRSVKVHVVSSFTVFAPKGELLEGDFDLNARFLDLLLGNINKTDSATVYVRDTDGRIIRFNATLAEP